MFVCLLADYVFLCLVMFCCAVLVVCVVFVPFLFCVCVSCVCFFLCVCVGLCEWRTALQHGLDVLFVAFSRHCPHLGF